MRDHTKCRQDNDVNLWVTEEPEHMLEQYGITTTGRIKEAGAKVDIHQHHGNRACQYRHHRNQQESRN